MEQFDPSVRILRKGDNVLFKVWPWAPANAGYVLKVIKRRPGLRVYILKFWDGGTYTAQAHSDFERIFIGPLVDAQTARYTAEALAE